MHQGGESISELEETGTVSMGLTPLASMGTYLHTHTQKEGGWREGEKEGQRERKEK